MTGKELMEWIVENKAEEHVIYAVSEDHEYMRAKKVWEGENEGGTIMIDVEDDEIGKA